MTTKDFFLTLLIELIWYALTCKMTQLHGLNIRQHGKYLKTNVGATKNYKIILASHRISTAQSIQDFEPYLILIMSKI